MKLVTFRFVAMKNLLLVAVAISILSSCSAPKIVAETANKDLSSACRAIFLDSGYFRYQHVANAPLGGRAVLALSDDPQYGQSCAWARGGMGDVQDSALDMAIAWEKIEFVAIARCEAAKPANVKTPCKVYSRNNKIVWRDTRQTGLD